MHPSTAWTFEASLPHHVRWVIAALNSSASLNAGAHDDMRRFDNLLLLDFLVFGLDVKFFLSYIASLLGSLGMDMFHRCRDIFII